MGIPGYMGIHHPRIYIIYKTRPLWEKNADTPPTPPSYSPQAPSRCRRGRRWPCPGTTPRSRSTSSTPPYVFCFLFCFCDLKCSNTHTHIFTAFPLERSSPVHWLCTALPSCPRRLTANQNLLSIYTKTDNRLLFLLLQNNNNLLTKNKPSPSPSLFF